MKNTAEFTFETVNHNQDNELHLVVSLDAPKTEWEETRAPVCVFPVIDISTSMTGSPLDCAKKSAIKLLEHLSPNDYSGLAVFGTDAKLISAPVKMTPENKTMLRNRIGDLNVEGCTNFSGGLLMGLSQLNSADLPENILLRVIMLTDGCANRGVATQYQPLNALLTKNRDRVSVSCFGYGEGANQELLSDLSRTGQGNYAFIQNPDDALGAFAKELGGLLSTYAQNIEVEITASNGHKIVEVVSDVDSDGDDKKVKVTLSDILSEERRDLVIKTKLSKQSKALPRRLTVFNVSVTYDKLSKCGKVIQQTETMKARIKFVKPSDAQDKPNKDLDKIVAMAEIVRAQIKAEEMAQRGDWSGAKLYLSDTSVSLNSRGFEKYGAHVGKVRSMFRDSATLEKNSSYLVSNKSALRRSKGTSAMNAELQNDIFDMGMTSADCDSPAQVAMAASFADDQQDVEINVTDSNIDNSTTDSGNITSESMSTSKSSW